MPITKDRMIEILEDNDDTIKTEWDGDNAMQGFTIIAKHLDPLKHTLIVCAEHDVVYGPSLDDLIQAGITEEDCIALRRLNWGHEDGGVYCFV